MDPKLSHCIANFAVKFIHELGTDKTTICSPLSAEMVLALLALGCRNQTHIELLLQALQIPDDDALRSSFAFLTSTLNSLEKVTLKMANKVYVENGKGIKPDILRQAEEVFNSSLEQLNFEEKEAAADVINKWVAQRTDNKIERIVSPDMFNSQTRLVLVNAVYFQGRWEIPFLRSRNKPFHVNNTTEIRVPQMYRYGAFRCGVAPELKAKLLNMRYQGLEAGMVIILPDEVEGLSFTLDRLLAGYDLMTDIADLKEQATQVQIPKFKAETTMNLKKMLLNMGVKSIFDKENSDIDILTSNEKLYVSEAVQKAFIEVDEKGTRVAACTGLVPMKQCSKDKTPFPRFIADHPFLYLLIVQGIPLFIGVYQGSEYEVASAPIQKSFSTDSSKE